jgi:hypothetical protein
MKNGVTSATHDDLFVGGRNPPKRRPRNDGTVFVYFVRPEPPEGWRPEGLPKPPPRT